MPLSIKNNRTERLARRLAKETGETITEAVETALKERLHPVKQRHHGRIMTEKLEDILRRVDALPTLDKRSDEEILGYDAHGIPADGN